MNESIRQRLNSAQWRPTESAGITFAPLCLNEMEGGSVFIKFDAGVVGRPHLHPAGEELFVISGRTTIGDYLLEPGDYFYTSPGATHDAVAHETTVIYLSAPKPPVFL